MIHRSELRAAGVAVALALAAALAVAAAAAPPAPPQTGESGAIDVLLLSPPRGEPLFGPVEVAVEVLAGEAVERVEIEVDGEPAGTLTEPPWRLTVDVGGVNREHSFVIRATGASGAVGEAAYTSPAIRVDQEIDAALRPLYVTVMHGDQRVLDLEREDFEVYDDGNRQELVTFARGDAELAAAVLVDASSSMRGSRLRLALRGAAAFAIGLGEADESSILLFADRILHATPFSSDARAILSGLEGIQATGGTALNDSLYLTLKRLEARHGRRVLILLSDGVDSHSSLTMEDVAWLARRSRTLIYWVRTDPGGGGKRFSAWKDAADYAAEDRLLSRIVEETGGRIVTLESIDRTADAMRGILAELREQYVIGYYPDTVRHDNAWHRVQVRTSRPGLRVRALDGYIDY